MHGSRSNCKNFYFLKFSPFTVAVDITLHQQGVLMVQENGTAAVVCEVQYSSALVHRFLTTFTWNGFPLQSGHPHLASGLLNVIADDCNQRYEGQVCEQFIMTIRGLSIANDSTIGCYSRDLSTFETVFAVGRVQVMLTPAPTPATQSGMCALLISYQLLFSYFDANVCSMPLPLAYFFSLL